MDIEKLPCIKLYPFLHLPAVSRDALPLTPFSLTLDIINPLYFCQSDGLKKNVFCLIDISLISSETTQYGYNSFDFFSL